MGARRWALAAAAGVIALAMAGCGGSTSSAGSTSGGSSSGSTTVNVVAATDVWGDVASQVAGKLAGSTVKITSIITNPDADPHSYQANTQNQLALSKAHLVIENGGGYDDFVATMLKASNNTSATVLNAVDISGKTAPAGGDLNEHVWYDFPTVQKVADKIAAALSSADPADAGTFQANLSTFDKAVDQLRRTEATIKQKDAGAGVAITEPVPLYMLEACGLVNRTPQEFSEAIENGTDVSATVLDKTLDLFTSKQVKLLAYNEQTTGPQTTAVLDAAKKNGIAVVGVTETLPSGQDYLSWMSSNLADVNKALS